MSPTFDDFVSPIRHVFASQRKAGVAAMDRLAEALPGEVAAWHAVMPVPAGRDGGNSIAVLVRHMRGNMRSRWTDFLTTDGEKPWRERDEEFVAPPADSTTPETIRSWWDEGWAAVFAAIDPLQPADLEKTITIRGQPHTVYEALLRQLSHYGYHVGQLIQLARWQVEAAGKPWKSLSIPRGQSSTYRPTGNHGEPPLR